MSVAVGLEGGAVICQPPLSGPLIFQELWQQTYPLAVMLGIRY